MKDYKRFAQGWEQIKNAWDYYFQAFLIADYVFSSAAALSKFKDWLLIFLLPFSQ
ncbi:hypothetical protein [Cytobacillus sp. FSL H8-0458]|uniref:hypothetical protein n=1 Tax=Cytobacillus sp. FSL H8-0458 TaxID=2975346 RepID=UPI0030F98AF7